MSSVPAQAGDLHEASAPTRTVLKLDIAYAKSPTAICIMVEWALSLIVVISAASGSGATGGGFAVFTGVAWLLFATFWFVSYFCKLYQLPGLNRLRWNLMTLISLAIGAVFYFISACICAAGAHDYAHYGAAAFFAFAILPVLGFHVYLIKKDVDIRYSSGSESQPTTGGEA